jgi:hypothetical protein
LNLRRRAIVFAISCSAVIAICGCPAPTSYTIQGVVCSTKRDIIGSYFQRASAHVDDDDSPLTGAKVELAFDEEGKQLIDGMSAISGPNGEYEIKTNGIPPPTSRYGEYFLIVSKNGFEQLIQPFRIGVMSGDLTNTVVLRAKGKLPR